MWSSRPHDPSIGVTPARKKALCQKIRTRYTDVLQVQSKIGWFGLREGSLCALPQYAHAILGRNKRDHSLASPEVFVYFPHRRINFEFRNQGVTIDIRGGSRSRARVESCGEIGSLARYLSCFDIVWQTMSGRGHNDKVLQEFSAVHGSALPALSPVNRLQLAAAATVVHCSLENNSGSLRRAN